LEIPVEVVDSLQVWRSYYNLLHHALDLPVDLPATCYNRKVDWVLPDRNVCYAKKRMEPLHRPGLLLYAFNHNDFRTFPDITETKRLDWQALEAIRFSKAVVTDDSMRDIYKQIGYPTSDDVDAAIRLVDTPRPRIAFIIDVYNWSWHIATRHTLKYWPEVCGDGDILDGVAAKFTDINDFDFIFLFIWANSEIVNKLDRRKSAMFLAGGKQLSNPSLDDAIKHFDVVCARNSWLASEAQKRFPNKQYYVLTNGVDTNHFKPMPQPHDEFTVGWVGRADIPLKRFELAKEVAVKADCKLKAATFEKRIPHELMPGLYNSVDVLLVTSEAEAHPLPVYEALSCGVPVVTTDVGDVREVIVHGENGFILPVNSPAEKFAEYINELKDDNVRKEFSRKSRETIVRNWSWETKIQDYKNFLEEMIGGENV